MKQMFGTLVLSAVVLAPAASSRAEVATATVNGRAVTYVATPAPATGLTPKEITTIAAQAKPSRPKVLSDPSPKLQAPK